MTRPSLFLASIALGLVALFSADASAADQKAAKETGILDGTVWLVELIPTRQTTDKDAVTFKDALTFSQGHFVSARLKKTGIEPVRYSADGADGFFNWRTAPAIRKKDAAEWGGVMNGRNIDGNLKWFTHDGRVFYYTIKGHRR